MTTIRNVVAGLPQANAAYQAALKRSLAGPAPSTHQEVGAALPRFETFLKGELETAANTMRAGEAESVKALTGRADLQQVVEAVTQAELSLQKVTAVRDRVISAYQEIMRMPI